MYNINCKYIILTWGSSRITVKSLADGFSCARQWSIRGQLVSLLIAHLLPKKGIASYAHNCNNYKIKLYTYILKKSSTRITLHWIFTCKAIYIIFAIAPLWFRHSVYPSEYMESIGVTSLTPWKAVESIDIINNIQWKKINQRPAMSTPQYTLQYIHQP